MCSGKPLASTSRVPRNWSGRAKSPLPPTTTTPVPWGPSVLRVKWMAWAASIVWRAEASRVRGFTTGVDEHAVAASAATASPAHLARPRTVATVAGRAALGCNRASSRHAPGRPDAGHPLPRLPVGGQPGLRAEVGRVPLHRVPRRARGGARQPQRTAPDPVLPRADLSAAGDAARALRP